MPNHPKPTANAEFAAAAWRELTRRSLPTLLLLASVFGLGLALASQAGFFGLPLALILLSWFCKYLYVLIDQLAHGYRQPPVMSIEMVNPFSEQRPLAQLLVVMAAYLGTLSLLPYIGADAVQALRVVLLTLLPASVAALAIDGRLWQAINPLAIWQVMRGLGPWYVAFILLALGSWALSRVLERLGLWRPLEFTLYLFAILLQTFLLGRLLYLRRAPLGISTWYSPEQDAAKATQRIERERAAFLDEIHALVRARSLERAWLALISRVSPPADAEAEYDWLCAALAARRDLGLFERLAQHRISQLLEQRASARALQIFERLLMLEPTLRPVAAAQYVTLVRVATTSGSHKVARVLLDEFEKRFAAHPAAPIMRQMRGKLG
jgi:hypothetical protein